MQYCLHLWLLSLWCMCLLNTSLVRKKTKDLNNYLFSKGILKTTRSFNLSKHKFMSLFTLMLYFHRISPLGRFGLVVTMSVPGLLSPSQGSKAVSHRGISTLKKCTSINVHPPQIYQKGWPIMITFKLKYYKNLWNLVSRNRTVKTAKKTETRWPSTRKHNPSV